MIKRIASYFLAACLVFTSGYFARDALAFVAPLPLLAFVAEGVDVGAGILIRQVGKEVLVNLGVAANDASWVTSSASIVSGLARIIGLGSYITGQEQKYQVQATSAVQLPATLPGSTPGLPGTYDNPLPFDSPSLRVKVGNGSPCYVADRDSVDGITHQLPPGVYSQLEWIAACKTHKARYLKPSVPSVEPYIVKSDLTDPDKLVKSFSYTEGYFQEFNACSGIWETRPRLSCAESYLFPAVSPVEGKDGIYRIKITPDGTGFAPDDTDPDWEEKNKFPAAQRIAVKGTNSANEAAVVEVARVGGRTQIKSSVQKGTNIKSRTVNLTNEAALDSVVESVAPGSLASYEPSVASGAVTEPTAIVFPTDYARQGEANTAANSLGAKLDTLTAVNANALSDPAMPGQSELSESFFDRSFDNLLAWTVPGHASTCPKADLSFTFFGQFFPLVMDTHCKLLDDVKPVLSDVMVVVWILAALFIVLGA